MYRTANLVLALSAACVAVVIWLSRVLAVCDTVLMNLLSKRLGHFLNSEQHREGAEL